MQDVTVKLIDYRKAEAERIARIDGHAILWHDEDWRTFGLDDPATDERGTTWRTFYSFEGGRFEGAVSSWTPDDAR